MHVKTSIEIILKLVTKIKKKSFIQIYYVCVKFQVESETETGKQ